MLYDSIKIKAKPVYDEDAVNLAYVGKFEDINVPEATNFVDAINKLKLNLDESISQGADNPLITQLEFIKGETFYNVENNSMVTLAYPNVDTNFFAQVQVDNFVASGETYSFEKWNFDTNTQSQWNILGDPVIFDSGLIKFNDPSLTCPNKYSILISNTNGLDLNKVNAIQSFAFLGSDAINVKFLISNNEKISWLNKNFETLPSSITDKTVFDNAWTADELINLSEANKLSLMENASNTLDIAILVEYTTETPYIDYLNINLTRKGYWVHADIEGSNKKIDIKKFSTGVEITNVSGNPIDLKVVAILGKSSTVPAGF